MVYVPVPFFFTNILPDKDIENSIFETKGKLQATVKSGKFLSLAVCSLRPKLSRENRLRASSL